jgi:hypothetical protein
LQPQATSIAEQVRVPWVSETPVGNR